MQAWVLHPRMEAERHPPPPRTFNGLFHIYCYLTGYLVLGIIWYLPSPHSASSTHFYPNVSVYLKELHSLLLNGIPGKAGLSSQGEDPALADRVASSRSILIHHVLK